MRLAGNLKYVFVPEGLIFPSIAVFSIDNANPISRHVNWFAGLYNHLWG